MPNFRTLMPKPIKPFTELEVKNLKPWQRPDGKFVMSTLLVDGALRLCC